MVWKAMRKIGLLISMIGFIIVLMVGPPKVAYTQDGDFWFNVNVFFDYVYVYDLTGSTVILTIDDPATPPIDFISSATVPEDDRLFFAEDFDVKAGHVVTVTYGETTKTHTVTGVRVASVDIDESIISGTAIPNSGQVEVIVWGENNGDKTSFFPELDENGNWYVDTTDTVILTLYDSGAALQEDGDGNATFFDWPLWFACVGFEPPLDNEDEIITVKKNRCFSFKAEIRDHQDILGGVTLDDIKDPPLIWVSQPFPGNEPSDILTIDGLSPGLETDGNQFEFIGGRWVFNLKVKNYSPGTYTVEMRPPVNMYRIDPKCKATFVVEK
jgi:hypothetical protein